MSDNTAAVLTEAERDDLTTAAYLAGDDQPTALYAAAERILTARLPAQPPQDDPQPDEREALAVVLWTLMWRGGGGVTFAEIGHHQNYYLDLADAVLASGFRRDPDAGLRERVESIVERWDSSEDMAAILMRAALRAALAEPTPEGD